MCIRDRGRLVAEVIGDAEAKGICGSGLLDATALMRRWGVIDETGKITGKRADLQFEFEGQPAFRLTNDVFLTQQDVREIQMAKEMCIRDRYNCGRSFLSREKGCGAWNRN